MLLPSCALCLVARGRGGKEEGSSSACCCLDVTPNSASPHLLLHRRQLSVQRTQLLRAVVIGGRRCLRPVALHLGPVGRVGQPGCFTSVLKQQAASCRTCTAACSNQAGKLHDCIPCALGQHYRLSTCPSLPQPPPCPHSPQRGNALLQLVHLAAQVVDVVEQAEVGFLARSQRIQQLVHVGCACRAGGGSTGVERPSSTQMVGCAGMQLYTCMTTCCTCAD